MKQVDEIIRLKTDGGLSGCLVVYATDECVYFVLGDDEVDTWAAFSMDAAVQLAHRLIEAAK